MDNTQYSSHLLSLRKLHSDRCQSPPGCHQCCSVGQIHTHTFLWHCCSSARCGNWWPTGYLLQEYRESSTKFPKPLLLW
ncbi:hypothetical protein GBAR_LOCUS15033, partial [Geodia barretti]